MRSFPQVLKIAGAYIAFLIGSGFATGQEIMQFFVSEGLRGAGGCLIFLALGTYLAISLLLAGQRHGLRNSEEVFRHYAGPVVGAGFAWYTVIVCYCVYVVMLAGTGAVLREQLGMNVALGAGLMATAVFATLYFGLRELVDVIGTIGPLLVVLIMLIAGSALLRDAGGVQRGNALVGALVMLHASGSWWMSGLVYTAMCTVGLAGLLPPLGATIESPRVALYAGIAGPLVFSGALLLCTLALLAGIPAVTGNMVPMLQLAQGALPFVAPMFFWIVLAGIFTTAAPMLWIAVAKFAADRTPRYRVLAVAFSLAGYGAGIALPFDRLLNLIYPTVGYSGMLLIGFVLAKQIRTRSIA